jgi:hypothetical protein
VSDDGTIRVWSAASHSQVYEFDAVGEGVTCAAFHPSGCDLACGFDSGVVRVFDITTAALVQEMKQHDGPVAQVGGGARDRGPIGLRSWMPWGQGCRVLHLLLIEFGKIARLARHAIKSAGRAARGADGFGALACHVTDALDRPGSGVALSRSIHLGVGAPWGPTACCRGVPGQPAPALAPAGWVQAQQASPLPALAGAVQRRRQPPGVARRGPQPVGV